MSDKYKELEYINLELMHLNQVMQTVNSTLDLDEVVTAVTKALQEIFSFNQIGIFLLDQDRKKLHPSKYYGEGVTQEIFERFNELDLPIQPCTSIICKVILKNKYYNISPVTPELVDQFLPLDQEIYKRNPVKAYVLFPQGNLIKKSWSFGK